LGGGDLLVRERFRRGGVFGDFIDHAVGDGVEVGVARVLYRHVKGAQDELGAAMVDGVANEGVDDFHERGLDGFLVVEDGDGMEARLGRSADTANHALVEIAENFFAEGRTAAADSAGLDVGADASGLSCGH
jgi:hypothetical protein